MPLDPNALKAAQEELESKGSNSVYLNLKKDETKDIRILDPSPAMNGNWFIEVPGWWIGNTKVISPSFLGESDVVEDILEEIRLDMTQNGQEQLYNDLRYKKEGQYNSLVIRKQDEYFVPVLEFNWELDASNYIAGIYDESGNYDVNKIKNYIVGGKAQLLQAKISLIKDMNKTITARGNINVVDPEKGFNMTISRAGTGRDTVYSAVKAEEMPMPMNFYNGPDAIDPVHIVKSSMVTDNYIRLVLEEYFYGDVKKPEDTEYRFPELRDNNGGGSAPAEQVSARRGRPAAQEQQTDSPAPQRSQRRAATPPPADQEAETPAPRRGRAVDTAQPTAGRGTGASPRGRNLLDDVNES